MFRRSVLWIVALVAILTIIRWMFVALGLNFEVIDVNNGQQLAKLGLFFGLSLIMLGGFSFAVISKAIGSQN
ncbi:hypothetical protein MUP46_00605 [Patescibacteria group bacterium]|nr:hypothetical protein [Patescibacteria group bacterium]